MVPRGCCYVLLLDLPLHLIQQLIGADGLGSKAVVLPPCQMAAAVVRPAVTHCSTLALSMGSTGLPAALSS